MLDELKKIADEVNTVLNRDDFPNGISPDYLKNAVLAYPQQGGKRLRPAIAMWFCGLFSQKPQMALYPACAIEIYHTWTLVHDDIIDNDSTRRGHASTHELLKQVAIDKFNANEDAATHFGRSFAILAGDLQQSWAFSLLLKANGNAISNEITMAITDRMTNHLYPRLLSGEAIDVEFEHRDILNISEDEILNMLTWKTGVLLQFAAETGAVIGHNSPNYRLDSVRIAGEFALEAGLAFQLQDDILGIYADKEEWGKPVGNDIRVRKVTLIIKKALEMSRDEERAFLLKCLGNINLTNDDLIQVRKIIINCGALAAIEEMAKDCIKKAKESLYQLPDNHFRGLLEELADYLIQREH